MPPALTTVQKRKLNNAIKARKQAEEANRRASEATRDVVIALTNAGMSYTDIGRLLGISKMRVCQLYNSYLGDDIQKTEALLNS